ncbi:Hypothetical protein MPV1_18 [Marinitoga phage MPV1]
MFKITEPKERLYCEKCGKLVSYTITEKDEIFKIKKDEIRIKSTMLYAKSAVKNYLNHIMKMKI